MNSYQRRKREIAYLSQRGEDLERLCFTMARRLGELGAPVPMAGGPVDGDRLLNDITAGDFTLRLALAADAARPRES